MDYKLQLVVVPVSDLDRAKDFYLRQAGFGLHLAGRGVPCHPPEAARL